jgi:hypothetical protein
MTNVIALAEVTMGNDPFQVLWSRGIVKNVTNIGFPNIGFTNIGFTKSDSRTSNSRTSEPISIIKRLLGSKSSKSVADKNIR